MTKRIVESCYAVLWAGGWMLEEGYWQRAILISVEKEEWVRGDLLYTDSWLFHYLSFTGCSGSVERI